MSTEFPRSLAGGLWTLKPAHPKTASLVDEIGHVGGFKIVQPLGSMKFELWTDIPHPDDPTASAAFALNAAPSVDELAALLEAHRSSANPAA